MNFLARFISGTMAEIVHCPADPDKIAELQQKGFVEFIPKPEPEIKQGEMYELSYILLNDKVHQSWAIVKDKGYYQKLVDLRKAELSSSDYKIIKCYEASLTGSQMPYNVTVLVAQRQSIRDDINNLESAL